ncbi:DUF3592 domain-containing protein [Mariniblastus fucicola]
MFAPILALLLLHIVNTVYRGFTEPRWLVATGTIEESSIQHDHDSICLLIRYQFHINDQPYWGNESIWCRDEEDAQNKLARFPVGIDAEIEFRPNDPETRSRLFLPIK